MTTPSRTSQSRDRAGASPGRSGTPTPSSARMSGLQNALGNQAMLRLLGSGVRTATPTPSSALMSRLQEAVGNQAMLRLLGSGVLQAKSDLSQPGDPLEAEADRVAREIVSQSAAPALPRKIRDDAPLAVAEPAPASAPPAVGDALRSAGQPLDPGTRHFMEERFGRDFGSVRVHTGPAAEAAAGSIQARAFTVGSDVVFGGATSDPGHGGELLAHELTHVAQQGHAGSLASTAGGPRISRATGAAGILRQAEPAEKTAAEPDYAALAVQIRKAIVGWGTDEEAVYRALRQLGRDANKIARLEALYLAQFGDSLEDDIRGDFSGSGSTRPWCSSAAPGCSWPRAGSGRRSKAGAPTRTRSMKPSTRWAAIRPRSGN